MESFNDFFDYTYMRGRVGVSDVLKPNQGLIIRVKIWSFYLPSRLLSAMPTILKVTKYRGSIMRWNGS